MVNFKSIFIELKETNIANGKGPVLPGQVCLLQVPKSVGSPLLHNFGSNTRLVSKVFFCARGSNARLP